MRETKILTERPTGSPQATIQAPVGLEACWVADGRLLAGAHPAAGPYPLAQRLEVLLEAGVRHFVDLTVAGELSGYEAALNEQAAACDMAATYTRAPLPARSVPQEPAVMEDVLRRLDDRLARNGVTYIHGRDPMRRTGLVVGCFLVCRGQASGVALDWLETRHWRNGGRLETRPLTNEQRDYVRFWGDRIAA